MNVVIGQYIHRNSYIHKMDPRVKILGTILMMVGIFFLKDIYQMLGALALVILIILSAKLPFINIIKGMKPLLMISFFVFVFQVIFNQQGEVIYSTNLYFNELSILAVVLLIAIYFIVIRFVKVGFLSFFILVVLSYLAFNYVNYEIWFNYSYNFCIYQEGLNLSIFVFLRLIAVVEIATLLTLTTKPTDMTLGIERLLKWMKIFKIDSEEIGLMITIVLRFIPTVLDEAYKIMDAQASRGSDFKEGNIKNKVSQIVSLLVPMFVVSLSRSDELADAMIARNFIPGKAKTRYHKLKWSLRDTFGLLFSLLFLGASICLYIL